MEKELYERIKTEIGEFREKANSYVKKEISLKDFKGYSGGFGSYGERGGNSFMLRLRMNQGRMTKEKLAFVVENGLKYDVKKIHFTTCETIQFHNLSADTTADIMEKALECDIVCRGGGGDFPRNVMANPLSGVNMEEKFDVLPYASKVSDYLLSIMLKVKLPRKLKVAFENTNRNDVHATFRDLGFVAEDDGTFSVYCAGGLGQNPKMGVLVASHIQPNKVLYCVKAMVDLFVQYGNYTNRAKARTRYLQETLGVEELKNRYQEKLQLALKEEQLDFEPSIEVNSKKGKLASTESWRLLPQKQEGLYTVLLHPICGDITIFELKAIYDVIKNYDNVELRIGPDQTIYIINLNGDEVNTVLDVTKFGAKNAFETSVSCVGASICQVGLRDSHGMLHDLIYSLRNDGNISDYLPRIHVSGCPSSCGTHQIGKIGFQGSFKLVDKKPEPAFIITINGNDLKDNERFGNQIGTILQVNIYPFFKELGSYLVNNKITFDDLLEKKYEEFNKIISKYIN